MSLWLETLILWLGKMRQFFMLLLLSSTLKHIFPTRNPQYPSPPVHLEKTSSFIMDGLVHSERLILFISVCLKEVYGPLRVPRVRMTTLFILLVSCRGCHFKPVCCLYSWFAAILLCGTQSVVYSCKLGRSLCIWIIPSFAHCQLSAFLLLHRLYLERQKPSFRLHSVKCGGTEVHLSLCPLEFYKVNSTDSCQDGSPVVISCTVGPAFVGHGAPAQAAIKKKKVSQQQREVSDSSSMHLHS